MRWRQLPEFEYIVAKDREGVSSFLREHQDRARLMAGGTDLLIGMKQRTVRPRFVIALKHMRDLDFISLGEVEGLRLGALVTHQAVVEEPAIRKRFRGLWTACSKIATPQIRNMATLGGNLCNAAPSADAAPPLIASGAVVKIFGSRGERSLALEDFFVGPGQTALEPGDILTEIDVPSPPRRSGLAYVRLPARTEVDIAAVCAAAFIVLDGKNETCDEARIVLGAVAPTPLRSRKAEAVLRGETLTDSVIQKAAEMASRDARPISDVRSSATYRSEMVSVLTQQAVREALEQAKSL